MRGLANYQKRKELFYQFHLKKYDIMFLQETHSDLESEKKWQNEFGSKIVFDHC